MSYHVRFTFGHLSCCFSSRTILASSFGHILVSTLFLFIGFYYVGPSHCLFLCLSLKLNLFVLPSKWRLLLPQTISVLYNKKRYSSFFIKNNFLLLLEHIVSVPETKGKTRRERERKREPRKMWDKNLHKLKTNVELDSRWRHSGRRRSYKCCMK